MLDFLMSTDVWGIILKVIITAAATGIAGLICTLFGKLIISCKNSKMRNHAKIAVEAAEQKFPNEGKKMGPEKMAYVMDYLAITYPKIKDNQFLYNVAEAAVYELNNQNKKEAAKDEFKIKYGELPEEIVKTETITNTEANDKALADDIKGINKKSEKSDDNIQFSLKSF